VFIDGLHYHKQVDKDISNALRFLNPGGVIMMHDCRPLSYKSSLYPYAKGIRDINGDCYKSLWKIRSRPDVDAKVLNIDWGLGLIQKASNSAELKTAYNESTMTNVQLYQTYMGDPTISRVSSWNEIKEWLPSVSMDRNVTNTVLSNQIIPMSKSVIKG